MNDVKIFKTPSDDELAKIISEFNLEDYSNRDVGELQVLYVALMNYLNKVLSQISEFESSPAYSAVVTLAKTVKGIIKSVNTILSSRVDASNFDDKTLIRRTDDAPSDSDSTDEEVVVEEKVLQNKIKYHFNTVEDYNLATGKTLTENDYYHELLLKFVSLHLLDCFKIGKKRLSLFPDSVIENIINNCHGWNILVDTISADETKLTAYLNDSVSTTNDLLESHYVVREYLKDFAKRVQLSLFDFDYAENINVLEDNGGISDEN